MRKKLLATILISLGIGFIAYLFFNARIHDVEKAAGTQKISDLRAIYFWWMESDYRGDTPIGIDEIVRLSQIDEKRNERAILRIREGVHSGELVLGMRDGNAVLAKWKTSSLELIMDGNGSVTVVKTRK
jgi:hypothetical protein